MLDMTKEAKIALLFIPETKDMNNDMFETFSLILRCHILKNKIDVNFIAISPTILNIEDVAATLENENITKIPEDIINKSLNQYFEWLNDDIMPEMFSDYTLKETNEILIMFKQ